jgi:hypothetical protein
VILLKNLQVLARLQFGKWSHGPLTFLGDRNRYNPDSCRSVLLYLLQLKSKVVGRKVDRDECVEDDHSLALQPNETLYLDEIQ